MHACPENPRCAARDAVVLVVLALTAPFGACVDNDGRELAWRVRFACSDDRAESDQLRLRLRADDCKGETFYETLLARGEQAAAATDLGPGGFGLEAAALKQGETLAMACLETTLPSAQPLELVLMSDRCRARAEDMAQVQGEGLAGERVPSTCSRDCSDLDACTDDRCEQGSCVYRPYSGERECDGIACTQGDRCRAGECQPGGAASDACPDDDNPCTVETCVAGVGCMRSQASGTPCNDGLDCTQQDRCRDGVCRGEGVCGDEPMCSAASPGCACAGPEDCDDRNPCTDDACTGGECQHAANAAPCDDGQGCTLDDRCVAGVCVGGAGCPEGTRCADSSCACDDPATSICGAECVNLSSASAHCGMCGRACPAEQSCENGACKPAGARSCSAYRYGDHDYLVCAAASTWTGALAGCQDWGMGLAIIDDESENAFLTAQASGADRWIGANDRGGVASWICSADSEEGRWYWASATSDELHARPLCTVAAVRGSCGPVDGAYQNWRSGQPDSQCQCMSFGCDEAEDCAVLVAADGLWNDRDCGLAYGFICEAP